MREPLIKSLGAGNLLTPWGMGRASLRGVTAAFVLITWLTLAGGDLLGLARNGSPAAESGLDVVDTVLGGIGQVMFQENVVSGAVFLVGIAVCSRRAALVAIIGSATGCIAALAAQLPAVQVSAGLFSYNSVLAALALRAGWPAVLGAVLAVPLTVVMQKLGVAPRTAPFLLATWTAFIIHRMTTPPPSKQKAQ